MLNGPHQSDGAAYQVLEELPPEKLLQENFSKSDSHDRFLVFDDRHKTPQAPETNGEIVYFTPHSG
jgi:hypothetical protein